MKKKLIIFLIPLVIVLIFYIIYSTLKAPYSISEDNIKSIYCEYYIGGTKILPVNELDKKTIISEISKFRETKTSGSVGTVPYKFIIELTNGHKVEFIENTKDVIQIHSDIYKHQRKINAPKTAEFIRKFIKDNNLQL
jgi:hypothetical protein